MKIMTHGGITNIVRGIELALGFESGENWSDDQMAARLGPTKSVQELSLIARSYPFIDHFALTLRECAIDARF
jgi:hypothetical protein